MAKKKTNYLLGKKFKFQPRPKPPLGPYTKPRVAIVKLDPEQAILAACRVNGGGYFGDWFGSPACKWGVNATLCPDGPVRGIHGARAGSTELAETPS